ncbi:MAG: hypothetical protein R2693_12035 [Nocardioidaceae bacterium]
MRFSRVELGQKGGNNRDKGNLHAVGSNAKRQETSGGQNGLVEACRKQLSQSWRRNPSGFAVGRDGAPPGRHQPLWQPTPWRSRRRSTTATPEPGETFTYTIQVRCSEDDCLDTQITDNFPAGLAGFEVQGFNLSPSASSIPRTVTWTPGGGATPPSVMTASTSLTIDLQQVTNDPVGVGIKAGSSFTIQLSLKVPDDYPPSASGPIVNTASVSASNADTKVDDATITVDAKVKMGVDVTKTWTPATQNHFPGTGFPTRSRGQEHLEC